MEEDGDPLLEEGRGEHVDRGLFGDGDREMLVEGDRWRWGGNELVSRDSHDVSLL